ncbi:hypothetical protein, partial [Aminobacter sp. BE322]|uniref:hypothetical protein n=1 Tax=unclassified Aminobacter TaxID=2644704 RepID=UPI003D1BAF0F
RAALVVEAYIVAPPSNCQRPFSDFCEFFATKPQTPEKPCVRATKNVQTHSLDLQGSRNLSGKSKT